MVVVCIFKLGSGVIDLVCEDKGSGLSLLFIIK